MNTAIVIPIHGALIQTDEMLDSMVDTIPPCNVVCINDGTASQLKKELERVVGKFATNNPSTPTTLLTNEKQQLFTRTVNRGIRYAVRHWNPDLILCINTDCILKQGWYEHLVGAFEDQRVGIAGYRDGYHMDYGKPYTEVKKPDYITGHCFGMRVSMLREVGVLCETDTNGKQDPDLAPFLGQAHIGSERILCWKANIYGWKTSYCNKNLVDHGTGASWGRDLGWLSNFDLQPLWEASDVIGGGLNE